MNRHAPLFIALSAPWCETLGHQFTPIDGLNGPSSFSRVTAISADGMVVVGSMNSDLYANEPYAHGVGLIDLFTQPFRWTATDGTVGLGNPFDAEMVLYLALYASPFESYANSTASAVSADGSYVVGWGQGEVHPDQSYYQQEFGEFGEPALFFTAFRWPEQGASILSYSSYDRRSEVVVSGLSANANRVVGTLNSNAVMWSRIEMGGVSSWEVMTLGSASAHSRAYGISAFGSVVVGWSDGQPFRWTAATGMMHLDNDFGSALGLSADGRVIVGQHGGWSTREAFRWTQNEGMVTLPDLPGGEAGSSAMDASGDGAFIVGTGTTATGPEAVLWDDSHGVRSIRQILESRGIDLTGWALTEAVAISDDGTVVAGNGINPSGTEQGWVVRLGSELAEPAITRLERTGQPRLFLIHYTAPAGQTITLEFSTDLETWEDMQSVPAASAQGVIEVTAPTDAPCGYWRLRFD